MEVDIIEMGPEKDLSKVVDHGGKGMHWTIVESRPKEEVVRTREARPNLNTRAEYWVRQRIG